MSLLIAVRIKKNKRHAVHNVSKLIAFEIPQPERPEMQWTAFRSQMVMLSADQGFKQPNEKLTRLTGHSALQELEA